MKMQIPTMSPQLSGQAYVDMFPEYTAFYRLEYHSKAQIGIPCFSAQHSWVYRGTVMFSQQSLQKQLMINAGNFSSSLRREWTQTTLGWEDRSISKLAT